MKSNYASLAQIYDRLMAHVEYDEWVIYIKKILETHCFSSAPALVEIGGGTGILARKLVENGIRYSGSDYSPAMCRQAKKKGVNFFIADVKSLPIKKHLFDMAMFLYDGINYLQSLSEYKKCFENIYECLKPDGLFLFDITTQYNSITNFNGFFDTGDLGDYFYSRHSYYNSETAIQYNDFTIFSRCEKMPGLDSDEDIFYKSMEHHAQKVPPVTAIRDAVPCDLFDIIGIWDGFSFKRFSSRSVRVHFLLRKKTI
jgi:ubiquinone/menaquinone biosynthesis C-methylase UbiE